jgi:hypothetical protein
MRARTNKNSSWDLLALSVTDFQSIAARVLEEDGVVMCLFIDRSFNISRTGLDRDRSQPINLADIVGRQRDTMEQAESGSERSPNGDCGSSFVPVHSWTMNIDADAGLRSM